MSFVLVLVMIKRMMAVMSGNNGHDCSRGGIWWQRW